MRKEVQSCANLVFILNIGDDKKNMKGWDYSQLRNGGAIQGRAHEKNNFNKSLHQ